MVNELWKRELRPRFLLVEHHKPEQFILCQWQTRQEVHVLYFVYKWLMAAVFLITMICSICDAGRPDDFGVKYIKWGIYLTNWGYTFCTLQAMLGASLLTQQFLKEKKHGKYLRTKRNMPFGYKVYWVCHTISVVVAIGITVSYWATVYNPAQHKLDTLNVIVHAFNSVFMLIDFLLVAHPFRLLHCYWPFLFITSYIIFSVIYFELGGTDRKDRSYIYPLLDWKRPRRTLLAAAFGLIFVLAVHCIVWILFLLRRWLAVSLSKKQQEKSNEHAMSPNSIQLDIVV